MAERDLQAFFKSLARPEESDRVFDAETAAWLAATTVQDYMAMTRAGLLLPKNIYGEPFASRLDEMRDRKLSDDLARIFDSVTVAGVQPIRFVRPSTAQIFNHNPYLADPLTRDAYDKSFYDQLRDLPGIKDLGPEHFLEQVPPYVDAVVYMAPDGFKSFVTSEGYTASGFNIEPDLDRPFGQRGGERGFLRAEYQSGLPRFEEMSRQLMHLASMGRERFAFGTYDALGYRPFQMTPQGLAEAWAGWDAA
jgi:hypothetical protein